ncbi:MAG: T9SS type A sorting domain-containing protein [Chitinophagaceae bacterium]|nr:T9SS type A sorting domain-containing protein [Chitinophagaceae bacterium]
MAHAQVPQPELLWMRSIGGSASESISSWVHPTPDGGFITRIESTSPAGTGNIDSFCSPVERRMIFTKFNNDATVAEWSNCFGTQGDSFLLFLYSQADGSYILLGDFKGSGALIKKYNPAGGEVWQKNYSKGNAGKLYSALPVADGGYILLCSRHYTDTNVLVHYGSWETGDYWLAKLDSNGNKVWSKVIGGADEEDRGMLVQGEGRNYYIVGITSSNDNDCIGNHGGADIFVARCNDTGGVIWKKCLGGSDNETAVVGCRNANGGIIICGSTKSTDGDVHHHIGGEDYWLCALDSNGVFEWDNCFGTTENNEQPQAVCLGSDGTIWANGQSFTPNRDVYLVHTSSSGGLLHQRVLQSTYEDEGQMLFPISGGKTLVGGYSVNLNGDFSAIPYRGAWDVFLAVFAPWDAGIDDMATKELYHIFPNPTRGELTIETKETSVSHRVTLTDVFGRVVMRGFIQKGVSKTSLYTGSLPQGIYNVSVVTEQGNVFHKMIVAGN